MTVNRERESRKSEIHLHTENLQQKKTLTQGDSQTAP